MKYKNILVLNILFCIENRQVIIFLRSVYIPNEIQWEGGSSSINKWQVLFYCDLCYGLKILYFL
jgi:hypothetical protein